MKIVSRRDHCHIVEQHPLFNGTDFTRSWCKLTFFTSKSLVHLENRLAQLHNDSFSNVRCKTILNHESD